VATAATPLATSFPKAEEPGHYRAKPWIRNNPRFIRNKIVAEVEKHETAS